MANIGFVRGVLEGSKLLVKKNTIVPVMGFEQFAETSMPRLIDCADHSVAGFNRYLPDNSRPIDIERNHPSVVCRSISMLLIG